MSNWQVADVDEIPPVKEDWPATWKSVRHHFGITGFGINAVTKDAGNVLIPEHDETESGQQELYFVHAGEVEGDAGRRGGHGAGRLVRPLRAGPRCGSSKSAASPTTLIVIGGTPGRPYEVGQWEL